MAQAEMGDIGVLRQLRGDQCPVCEDGTLELGRYKGNRAVICEACETPRAQRW